MAHTVYISKAKETLDLICWRFYGFQVGTVEKVLEYNPVLHNLDEELPIGTIVKLPQVEKADETTILRLWDYEDDS